MGAIDDLQNPDLTIGRVVAADPHPGARGPSLLLTVDLDSRGRRQGSVAQSIVG